MAGSLLGPLTFLAQSAAVIAVDLQRRRRFRVNGWLGSVGRDRLTIEVDEAYGNCPSYIQQRLVRDGGESVLPSARPALEGGSTLAAAAVDVVRKADTFFVATQHPRRGADVSHKGGDPGFVRVDGADLLWPDYAGNNMFNTMGNLVADASAGLLFIDFETGVLVQLSGTAQLEWRSAEASAGDASTGRWVRFHTERGLIRGSTIRGSHPTMSPHNPPVLG